MQKQLNKREINLKSKIIFVRSPHFLAYLTNLFLPLVITSNNEILLRKIYQDFNFVLFLKLQHSIKYALQSNLMK